MRQSKGFRQTVTLTLYLSVIMQLLYNQTGFSFYRVLIEFSLTDLPLHDCSWTLPLHDCSWNLLPGPLWALGAHAHIYIYTHTELGITNGGCT